MLTLDDIRDALGATEPDYPRLVAEIGAEAIPFLRQLIVFEDRRVAAKAVYLGALLGDVACVRTAAKQASEYLRVAAVGAAADLGPSEATTVLNMLSNDPDGLVRGVARRYMETTSGPDV